MVEIQTRTVLKPVEETVVQLTLDTNQAEILARLLWCHVAGPDEGPRGVLESIGREIRQALLESGHGTVHINSRLTSEAYKPLFVDKA